MPSAPQPTRSKRQREERRFDQTQLHEKMHGQQIHRDYASHFFRWGWVSRHIKMHASVLDIGCGQDWPLLKVLRGQQTYAKMQPALYVGVDLNAVPTFPTCHFARVADKTSFVDDYKKASFVKNFSDHKEMGLVDVTTDADLARIGEAFDYATCFEVIEHMDVPDGLKLLKGMHHWLKPGGKLFLSTPVFDGKAALNHIHEYEIPELRKLIEKAGFVVEQRYGTFASMRDIKKRLTPAQKEVWAQVADYYSDDVMSLFMAPLYPDASRNNMWVCSKK